jgi:hypothetical protein
MYKRSCRSPPTETFVARIGWLSRLNSLPLMPWCAQTSLRFPTFEEVIVVSGLSPVRCAL